VSYMNDSDVVCPSFDVISVGEASERDRMTRSLTGPDAFYNIASAKQTAQLAAPELPSLSVSVAEYWSGQKA
jgi:hypothetical protein